jgi:tRNA-dihydrouridine synthase A
LSLELATTITKPSVASARRFSVAPMMDWTDRHCRYFHRLITPRALLFTEMVTSSALKHGEPERLLRYNADEHPVALQLGGSDPVEMAEAAKMGADFGYEEININVGCPSDRVQSGRFGACLMLEPETVAACVAAMKRVVDVPVTVKCRIGVDDQDAEAGLDNLTRLLRLEGVDALYVHARKAWLKGLSPKENRDIPPLDYDRVYRLKQANPDLPIYLNGGITTLEQSLQHCQHLDGVMLGREAYHNPWLMHGVDEKLFGAEPNSTTRLKVVEAMVDYMGANLGPHQTLHGMAKHLIGLYHGLPGARAWRRALSDGTVGKSDLKIVWQAALDVEAFIENHSSNQSHENA